MSKILAYLRTSTDKQDLNNQRLEILEYARRNDLHINDFIEISISSRKSKRARRIEELLDKLNPDDTLIVTELSRLGRSTKEALAAKKAQGVQLGKPKGTVQSSQFDKDRERIVELLSLGVSTRKIALDHLQYGNPSSLHHYVRTRNLPVEAEQLKSHRN